MFVSSRSRGSSLAAAPHLRRQVPEKRREMQWNPPPGWKVVTKGLDRRKPCHVCSRHLGRGDIVLIQSMRGRWRFRCVDTEDCESVRAMGKEPFFRPKYAAFARRLDAERAA